MIRGASESDFTAVLWYPISIDTGDASRGHMKKIRLVAVGQNGWEGKVKRGQGFEFFDARIVTLSICEGEYARLVHI